jgi:hypothetical protein
VADAFHIDRDRAFHAGDVLGLLPRPALPNADVALRFDAEYPGGLAPFGQTYVFGSGVEELVLTERKALVANIPADEVDAALNRSTNRLLELIWELVRLAWFRDRPSRLQSVFGYRDLQAARDCRAETFDDATLPIWRVRSTDAFECDSAWLDISGDGVTAVARACSYWKGDPRPGSLPVHQESLLVAPVTVVGLEPEAPGDARP